MAFIPPQRAPNPISKESHQEIMHHCFQGLVCNIRSRKDAYPETKKERIGLTTTIFQELC